MSVTYALDGLDFYALDVTAPLGYPREWRALLRLQTVHADGGRRLRRWARAQLLAFYKPAPKEHEALGRLVVHSL